MNRGLITKTDQSQDGNTVAGHLAGRDVVQTFTTDQWVQNQTNNLVVPASRQPTHMQGLIAKYKAEIDSDPALKQTLELLRNYTSRRGPAVGLKTKLTLADWSEERIEEAMLWKETFAKRLETQQFSDAAQRILAYILSKLHNTFKIQIRPLITGGASHEIIECAVIREVIQPLVAELEENPLGIYEDEIWGAIYYLTGNCLLWWHQEG